MRIFVWVMVVAGGASWAAVAEETSAQRLENTQKGIAEASWPKKPDNRLSPLSGKMKDHREVSVRYYGTEKEFRGKPADGWSKEASLGQKADWQGASGRRWEEARWNENRDWGSAGSKNGKFQPEGEWASQRSMNFRELEREPASGWTSRPAQLNGGREGSWRMYEGRLTRVRQHVSREQESGSARDLGPGRQEKYSPEEVEKMLSRPIGESRGAAKEQSPGASPLATADN